jgi:hypothetical protein
MVQQDVILNGKWYVITNEPIFPNDQIFNLETREITIADNSWDGEIAEIYWKIYKGEDIRKQPKLIYIIKN